MKRDILRVQRLCKSEYGVRILDDLYLNLYEGDVLGIIGLHDSGKSLLLNILSGKESWDSGSVFYDEERVTAAGLKKIGKIHLITEESALVPLQSVLENIFIIQKGFHLLINWKKLRMQAMNHFARLNVHINCDQRVDMLTPAQRHIVEIVRAYINGATAILIDSVITWYTPEEHEELRCLIRQLQKEKIAFIITGYKLSLLRYYAGWIQFLHNGSTLKIFKSEDINNLNENDFLNRPAKSDNIRKPPKQSNRIAIEAKEISTSIDEKLSFAIRQSEITAILDFEHVTSNNIMKVLLGQIRYNGTLYKENAVVQHFMNDRDVLAIDEHSPKNLAVKSLGLGDNICLSAYQRISRFGFASIRQKKEITRDFLSMYNSYGYEFNTKKLSQAEAVAIQYYRLLIQKWSVLLCLNAESLFVYEIAPVLKEQFRRMAETGRAVCFLSSALEPYSDFADSFYFIRNGFAYGNFTYQELLQFINEHKNEPDKLT